MRRPSRSAAAVRADHAARLTRWQAAAQASWAAPACPLGRVVEAAGLAAWHAAVAARWLADVKAQRKAKTLPEGSRTGSLLDWLGTWGQTLWGLYRMDPDTPRDQLNAEAAGFYHAQRLAKLAPALAARPTRATLWLRTVRLDPNTPPRWQPVAVGPPDDAFGAWCKALTDADDADRWPNGQSRYLRGEVDAAACRPSTGALRKALFEGLTPNLSACAAVADATAARGLLASAGAGLAPLAALLHTWRHWPVWEDAAPDAAAPRVEAVRDGGALRTRACACEHCGRAMVTAGWLGVGDLRTDAPLQPWESHAAARRTDYVWVARGTGAPRPGWTLEGGSPGP